MSWGGRYDPSVERAAQKGQSGTNDEPLLRYGQTLDLFRTLTSRFNLEELETVCWELGLKFEDLPAQTLSGKARQLVEKAAAQGVLDGLRGIVARERPS